MILIASSGCHHPNTHGPSERFIPASDPALLYSGRWDRSNPERPRASWPGFSVSTDFQGQSIHVQMNDAGNYYNVEVDGKFLRVIGGKHGSHLTYLLADHLPAGEHQVRLQRRNIQFDAVSEIEGFVVNEQARLTLPKKSQRKWIEFIGDSYTAAEGNEAVTSTLTWKEKFPVTNFAKGYAAMLGEMMHADVTAVCRSGSGLMCSWKGEREKPMSVRYDWTLMDRPVPAWKSDGPSPDLIVICLGLNDFSGLKSTDGSVSAEASTKFRLAYRQFIKKVRLLHPQSRIVALSPFTPWARESISAVVAAEKADGVKNIFYAQFDHFPNGYVANGHPTVETHRKMATQIFHQLTSLGVTAADGFLVDQ